MNIPEKIIETLSENLIKAEENRHNYLVWTLVLIVMVLMLNMILVIHNVLLAILGIGTLYCLIKWVIWEIKASKLHHDIIISHEEPRESL